MSKPPARTIVVGYDGSPSSRVAVDLAARRAGRNGLVVLVRSAGRGLDPGGARHELARELLDNILLSGGDALLATEWDTELIEGPAAAGIVRVARERDADEIVLGTRGHGATRSLLGSVSQEVIRHADRPVTVIPPRAVAPRAAS